MGKNFVIKVILMFLWSILHVVSSALAEEFIIDFSEEATLTKVFDSGLRPHRQRGGETTLCEARNVKVGFLLGEGYRINPVDCDWIFISIRTEYKISRIELRTSAISLEEAEKHITPFINSSVADRNRFKKWVDVVEREPLFFEEHFGIGMVRRYNPSVNAFFQRSGFSDHPVEFGIAMSWKFKPRNRYKFLKEPIQPPPGYEHVSMEPPPFKSSGELAAEKETAGAVEVSLDDEKSRGKEKSVGGIPESGHQIWLIALGAALVAGTLAWCVVRRQRS